MQRPVGTSGIGQLGSGSGASSKGDYEVANHGMLSCLVGSVVCNVEGWMDSGFCSSRELGKIGPPSGPALVSVRTQTVSVSAGSLDET